MNDLIFPRRSRGRPSARADAKYRQQVEDFCAEILEINSTLDFKVSSRGWGYIFENRRIITKDDLDDCQTLITDCRKSGNLPLDICSIDEARAFDHVEELDDTTASEQAECIIDYIHRAHESYTPFSFWDDQEFYLQCVVEKIDLKSLFAPDSANFHIPIANGKGWSDLHLRAAMMRRFAEWESKGKQCVLLYCGDHDPAGLNISGFLLANMAELTDAVGWSPRNLIIDRFGLNTDFIEANGLIWIDNLITESGVYLSNSKHNDHDKTYVQNYIRQFGVRKVEANALVVAPEAGRELYRQTIRKYVSDDAREAYAERLNKARNEVRDCIARLREERAP